MTTNNLLGIRLTLSFGQACREVEFTDNNPSIQNQQQFQQVGLYVVSPSFNIQEKHPAMLPSLLLRRSENVSEHASRHPCRTRILPWVSTCCCRSRRPLQTKVALRTRLVRPRNPGHIAHATRGAHAGHRHAFVRAMETHRTAQTRTSAAAGLVCPEWTQGEVFVRVSGAEGPLAKARGHWT